MRKRLTIADVERVDELTKVKFRTLGGCIASILKLDQSNEIKLDSIIIDFLITCRRDKEKYENLKSTIKPNNKGYYSRFNVLKSIKDILGEN